MIPKSEETSCDAQRLTQRKNHKLSVEINEHIIHYKIKFFL